MMIATTTRPMTNAMLVYRSIGATQPLWLKNRRDAYLTNKTAEG